MSTSSRFRSHFSPAQQRVLSPAGVLSVAFLRNGGWRSEDVSYMIYYIVTYFLKIPSMTGPSIDFTMLSSFSTLIRDRQHTSPSFSMAITASLSPASIFALSLRSFGSTFLPSLVDAHYGFHSAAAHPTWQATGFCPILTCQDHTSAPDDFTEDLNISD